MPDESIRNLLKALEQAYPSSITPYGSSFEQAEKEHGLGWRINGISAVFSAITLDGSLPADHYDIQIESYPPGDYIFTTQASLRELLQLIRRYVGPAAEWPSVV